MRTRLLLLLVVILGAFPAAMTARPAEAQIAVCADAKPDITLTPDTGPSGTQVRLRYRFFRPGDPLKVIFRVAGDPVVVTGTAEPDGEGYLYFTVPPAADGTYWVYVECHTAARFRVAPVTPTPTNSPTQTATPTRTPSVVPSTTPVPPTPVPPTVVPPTPLAPVAGDGSLAGGTGSTQFNTFALLSALALAAAGFGALGTSANLTARRRRSAYAVVTWWPGVPRTQTHAPDPAGQAISPDQLARRMRGPR